MHVDPSELVFGQLYDRLGAGRRSDVGLDRLDLRAAAAQLGGNLVEARTVNVGEHEVAPFGTESLGRGPGDAAAGAGDDHDLALQSRLTHGRAR